jgi:hypothetical protein
MHYGLSCSLLIVCLVATCGMQSPAKPAVANPQPRGAGAQPRDGSSAERTARMRGRVSDDQGTPLTRVWVAAHSGSSAQPASTMTDAEDASKSARLQGGGISWPRASRGTPRRNGPRAHQGADVTWRWSRARRSTGSRSCCGAAP